MAPLAVGLAIMPSDSVQETQVVGAGERADCLPLCLHYQVSVGRELTLEPMKLCQALPDCDELSPFGNCFCQLKFV